MEEKEFLRQEGRQRERGYREQSYGRRKKKRRKRKRTQRARKKLFLILAEAAAVVILVVLFFVLLFPKNGGETAQAAVIVQGLGPEEMDTLQETLAQQEEEMGTEEQVSTVKVVETETDEVTVGLDVSEYQGNIDWSQAAEGLDFVMVRVGYRSSETGEITEDACARYNLQEARDQGLLLGAYFFSTAVSEEEAVEEARWVCELLKGYPITYPVAYNCEGFQNPDSRQYALTAGERSRIAKAFLAEVEAQGYTGMFYAARNELKGNAREAALPKAEAADTVEADPEVGVVFTEVSEQVTAKEVTNLRSTMDQGSDGNIVAELHNGETALRTGTGNNGWSRVEYDGQTLYAVSSLLTTDLSYTPPAEEPESEFKTKFTTVSENVTAKDVTNLRNRPSVEEPSQVIVQLHNGEVIVRTGVSDVGWSRVEYNGQTLYCISSYLQVVN